MMNLIHRIGVVCALALICCFCASTSLALPPPVPLEDRVKESDLVVFGEIYGVRSDEVNSRVRAGGFTIRVEKVLKGTAPEQKEFSVSFIIFPDNVESRLREPPRPGRYYLFLNRQEVKDAEGKIGYALVLFRPHPYSYEPCSAYAQDTLNQLVGSDFRCLPPRPDSEPEPGEES